MSDESPSTAPQPEYRGTTAQVPELYPFLPTAASVPRAPRRPRWAAAAVGVIALAAIGGAALADSSGEPAGLPQSTLAEQCAAAPNTAACASIDTVVSQKVRRELAQRCALAIMQTSSMAAAGASDAAAAAAAPSALIPECRAVVDGTPAR